jgi:dihydrofolate synthase / folylpolyglutamate synthase
MVKMQFEESVKYLYSLGNEVEAMKLGLENIRTLLAALGDPQKNYLKVQVAGTNGKGSVCAFLNSIGLEAGVRTGLYTSPHLVSITERIKINGIDISEFDFARHSTLVRETAERLLFEGKLEYRPTFFEQVTAIALSAFAEAKVELAILETGLGGRLDATTAANAEIAVITHIDIDHQEYLGNTIEEIAAEKAAIIQGHTKAVIVGEQKPEAMQVIEERLRKFIGNFWNDIEYEVHRAAVAEERFTLEPFDATKLGIKGHHQLDNSRIAVMVAASLRKHFPIENEQIVAGLVNARHPGRLEYDGRYLFDGAHNLSGAIALVTYLIMDEHRPITLVFGAMNDKNVSEILAILAPHAEQIIVTEPSNSRSLAYGELLERLPLNLSKGRTFATDSVQKALAIANEITTNGGIILVTGSLYLVGEAKKVIKENPEFEI